MLAAFTLVGAADSGGVALGAGPSIRWMRRDGKTDNVLCCSAARPIAVVSFIEATRKLLAPAAWRRAVVARSGLAANS
jgi:hypothetical protein